MVTVPWRRVEIPEPGPAAGQEEVDVSGLPAPTTRQGRQEPAESPSIARGEALAQRPALVSGEKTILNNNNDDDK